MFSVALVGSMIEMIDGPALGEQPGARGADISLMPRIEALKPGIKHNSIPPFSQNHAMQMAKPVS